MCKQPVSGLSSQAAARPAKLALFGAVGSARPDRPTPKLGLFDRPGPRLSRRVACAQRSADGRLALFGAAPPRVCGGTSSIILHPSSMPRPPRPRLALFGAPGASGVRPAYASRPGPRGPGRSRGNPIALGEFVRCHVSSDAPDGPSALVHISCMDIISSRAGRVK